MRRFNPSLITLVITVQAALFTAANTIPIYWVNDEIMWHGSFWSMEQAEPHSLYTGFKPEDLNKPFNVYHADGTFRTRQVSYFIEMISFKFWQFFENIYTYNWTINIIHIANCILLALLTFRITGSLLTAIVCMLLLLNSGVALATLLYPFRNAKILAVTFFLSGWLLLTNSQKSTQHIQGRRLAGFCLMLVLGCLTDEISFFLFPIVYLYILDRDGRPGLINRRILGATAAGIAAIGLLIYASLRVSLSLGISETPLNAHDLFFKSLQTYYTDFSFLKDIGRAFWAYFLRKNFGYWDTTIWGILAFISFASLILMIILQKSERRLRLTALTILGVMFAKAVLLPHNAGVHHTFMPEGTTFPSLFFFSYYYPYAESVLTALALGLLLHPALQNKKLLAVASCGLTLIAASNVVHLRKGPQDVLQFMKFDESNREQPQRIVKNVLAVKPVIRKMSSQPVYLSFPAGETPAVMSRRNDPYLNLYARMIPVKYLKSIEQGRAIVSYTNTRAQKPWPHESELANASSFYDVYRREYFDLTPLHKNFKEQMVNPIVISRDRPRTVSRIVKETAPVRVVFFLKGKAGYRLHWQDQAWTGGQTFGQSYQMFTIDDLTVPETGKPPVLSLTVVPLKPGQDACLAGPFVLPE